VPQSHLAEQLAGAVGPLGMAAAGADHGQLHVVGRGQVGQEIVELKHEADDVAAEARRVAQPGHGDVVDAHVAGVGPVQPADELQQRALARAGRARQRDELARLEVERDVAQRVDLTVVALRDAIDGDRSSAQRLTLTA
jgi:hypothetical protein